MRFAFATLVAAYVVGMAVTGCISSSPSNAPEADTRPTARQPANLGGFSEEQLRTAKQLYTLKCARCHKFYDPASYNDEEWNTWMNKMSRKARLKPDQAQLLSRYLETFRPTNDANSNTPPR